MISSKSTLFYVFVFISIPGSYYFLSCKTPDSKKNNVTDTSYQNQSDAATIQQPVTDQTQHEPELLTMPVNEAVMVTVELDFGSIPPTIAEALKDIERVYLPDDGKGRTFAILDAYGEVTETNKLHISMHVSSEKPGIGKLKFNRTGEILWQSKIAAGTNMDPLHPKEKKLTILIDNADKKSYTVNGSGNPSSILEATIQELGIPVSTFWKEGAELDFVFIYSACGCPVKATVKRVGDKTARIKNLPVMFPDDPAALNVISRLMRWE